MPDFHDGWSKNHFHRKPEKMMCNALLHLRCESLSDEHDVAASVLGITKIATGYNFDDGAQFSRRTVKNL